MLLTVIDFVILGIIGVSMIVGLFRGLIREALSLAVWVAAAWVAMHYVDHAADTMVGVVDSVTIRLALGFVGLFLLALIVGGLIHFLIAKLIDAAGLTASDRFFGLLFGLGRGIALIVAAVLLASLTPMPEDYWWQESALLPQFEQAAIWARTWLPSEVEQAFRFPNELIPDLPAVTPASEEAMPQNGT